MQEIKDSMRSAGYEYLALYFDFIPSGLEKSQMYLNYNKDKDTLTLSIRVDKNRVEKLQHPLIDKDSLAKAIVDLKTRDLKRFSIDLTIDVNEFLSRTRGKMPTSEPIAAETKDFVIMPEIRGISMISVAYMLGENNQHNPYATGRVGNVQINDLQPYIKYFENRNIKANLTLGAQYQNYDNHRTPEWSRFKRYLTEFIPIGTKFSFMRNIILEALEASSELHKNAVRVTNANQGVKYSAGYTLFTTKKEFAEYLGVYPTNFNSHFWAQFFVRLVDSNIETTLTQEVYIDTENDNRLVSKESYRKALDNGESYTRYLRVDGMYEEIKKIAPENVDLVEKQLKTIGMHNLTRKEYTL